MVAIACVGVGVTLATWSAKTSATNIVTLGNIDVDLIDEYPDEGVSGVKPGQVVDKVVSAKNTGTEPCYVRIYVKKEWRDPSGNVTTAVPVSYIIPQFNTTDWVKGQSSDPAYDCYYYQSIVTPNQTANSLFETFTLSHEFDENSFCQYKGCITVKAEGVQSAYIDGDLIKDGSGKIIGWPTGLVFD